MLVATASLWRRSRDACSDLLRNADVGRRWFFEFFLMRFFTRAGPVAAVFARAAGRRPLFAAANSAASANARSVVLKNDGGRAGRDCGRGAAAESLEGC